MIYKLIIPGTFASLNEFIDANRRAKGKWNKGNQMKQADQQKLIYHIKSQLRKVRIDSPVHIRYHFYEPNKRRDLDNISGYFHKIFQDALVAAGVLHNDSWTYIIGMTDEFSSDNKDPRIEITITETRK